MTYFYGRIAYSGLNEKIIIIIIRVICALSLLTSDLHKEFSVSLHLAHSPQCGL